MRRKKRAEAATEAATTAESGASGSESAAGPASGPYDIDDIDPGAEYLDLGSMLIQPVDSLELRVQVDEESGAVGSVLLVGPEGEGALEVRAFASSRSGDLWTDARREIAADTTRRGGTATEQEGPFGTELACQVPVTGPNGESLVQPSRVLGHTGPRWFLRATIAGRPAVEPETAGPYEQVFAHVVVNRGTAAMAPGDALPLRLPPEAVSADDQTAG